MIIHKLISLYLKHRDDNSFYVLQAEDAVRWIEQRGVKLGQGVRALDLGCGHGIFGRELVKRGCSVTFADTTNYLLPELTGAPYRRINIDQEDLASLGQYDLVVCSNVFEHLSKPDRFLASIDKTLEPQGKLYLSWTNWLSPWGGHEFSPYHYLGAHRGYRTYHKLGGKIENHQPYENLFPTYIGSVLRKIRRSPNLAISSAAPRYYTEFAFLLRLPIIREFLAWNCALLIQRKS